MEDEQLADGFKRLLAEPLKVQAGQVWCNIHTKDHFRVVSIDQKPNVTGTIYVVVLDSGGRWEINRFLSCHMEVL